MSKKCFTEPANGILLNDTCVFGAEVFVIKNQRVMENVSVLALYDPCTRKWEISDFSKQDNVWNSEEFSAGGYKWYCVCQFIVLSLKFLWVLMVVDIYL